MLTKAGQWTEISETMNSNASASTKTTQVRRLIHTLKNAFSPDEESDEVLVRLLEEGQEHLLPGIESSMSESQFTELFMLILDEPKQRPRALTEIGLAEKAS